MDVTLKRIYDEPSPDDGARVLVDRIWPRGVRKEDAHLDAWVKEVAPSTQLRRWYGHDPEKFEEFARRYREELQSGDGQQALEELRRHASDSRLTLLTASKDVRVSQAAVLVEVLSE